jgi:hypothetical protein
MHTQDGLALDVMLSPSMPLPQQASCVAGAVSVFARLLLHNTAAFLQLFRTAAGHPDLAAAAASAATGSAGNDPAQALLLALLDLWLDKTDAIGESWSCSAAWRPVAVMPTQFSNSAYPHDCDVATQWCAIVHAAIS